MGDLKLGYYIKLLQLNFEKGRNQALLEYNLTDSQFSVLMYLLRHNDKDINQKELEQHFQVSKATLSGILKRLEAKEFIFRESSGSDKRNKYIRITENGFRIKMQIISKIEKQELKALAGFSDDEKLQFVSFLKRCRTNIYGEEKYEKN
jgi:MarR family transcriptional repressor of mepA